MSMYGKNHYNKKKKKRKKERKKKRNIYDILYMWNQEINTNEFTKKIINKRHLLLGRKAITNI